MRLSRFAASLRVTQLPILPAFLQPEYNFYLDYVYAGLRMPDAITEHGARTNSEVNGSNYLKFVSTHDSRSIYVPLALMFYLCLHSRLSEPGNEQALGEDP